MDKAIKLCLSCKKPIEEENLHINYCVKCKKRIDKNKKIQSENRANNSYKKIEFYINEYTKNNGKYLTPNGFNEISPVTAISLIRSIKGKTWVDILKLFGKDDEFKIYFKKEYNNYLSLNSKGSFTDFINNHKYLTYQILKTYGIKDILEYCEQKYYRIEDNDYKDNFNNIKKQLGCVPLHQDFQKLTKINLNLFI